MRIELRSGVVNGRGLYIMLVDDVPVVTFTRKGDAKRTILARAADAKRKGIGVTLIGMVG